MGAITEPILLDSTGREIVSVLQSIKTALDGQSGGAAPAVVYPKDVNFYDYDGTLLHSYTVEEAQAMAELPPLPKHDGLICQEWNWDLADIKAHNRKLTIGANYITDDGKTRIYIELPSKHVANVTLRLWQEKADGVLVDWGDGVTGEHISTAGNVAFSHVYAEAGAYTIRLTSVSGQFRLGDGSSQGCFLVSGQRHLALKRAEFGAGWQGFGYNEFHNSCIETVTIPKDAEMGSGVSFPYSMIRFFVVPKTKALKANMFQATRALVGCATSPVCFTATYAFANSTALDVPNIPEGTTTIANSYCREIYGMQEVTIPASVTKIESAAFYACIRLACVKLLSPTPPTLENANAFTGYNAACVFEVPKGSLEAYQTATNWTTFADIMREAET